VLSRDGTFAKLRKNTSVELALRLRANGRTKVHLFEAQVSTVGRDGAALIFSNADIDAYSALLHLTLNHQR